MIIAKGQGPAESHPAMVEAYRGEAYGLAAATSFIQAMLEFFEIRPEKHRWFFHIDNKAIIRRMESYTSEKITPKWTHFPDIDITNIAHAQSKNLTPQFRHVKEHQNDQSGNTNISFPAQLNIMADSLATQQRGTMARPTTQVTTNHSHLQIGDMFVTRDSQRWLMETAGKTPIQKYYQDKYGWSRSTFDSIDWELQWKALTSYDINDQKKNIKIRTRMAADQQSALPQRTPKLNTKMPFVPLHSGRRATFIPMSTPHATSCFI
jgi:hypothetical protein